MSKTVVQSFSAHLARFSPTRCARLFPALQAENEFSVLRTGMRFAAPSSFPLPEKEERPAGVEEKEGLPHSACSALPTGAVRLFVKRCFSCGLRPKGAAAGKNYAPNVRHLSEQNLCVYAKAMLSRSKAALPAKGSNSFEFLLWRAFCMRIYSLSAAAPLARQYLLHPLSGGSVDVSANLKAVTAVQSCVSIVWHLSGQNNICCTRQRQRR